MNDDAPTPTTADERTARRKVLASVFGVLRFLLILALLAGGVYAAYWFNQTENVAKNGGGVAEEASRLVVVDIAERATVPVGVRAMGTVMPAREAVIRPRVSGMLVDQADQFVPGGHFEEGAFMVQLDRADYEQALEQRLSTLAQAEAALQIELGDQAVAEEELELLGIDIPEINRELILRIPQVNQAKAEIRSAEAAVMRAELDLERTSLAAPFTGQIVERTVSVGNNVNAGDAIATFVGSERYWIELTVPVSYLRWIRIPEGGEPGSAARVRNARAWGPDASREGEVTQRIGRLEMGSRLARVIVSVPDPLARSEHRTDGPELILGAYVDVEIRGRELEGAFVIDRNLIREGDVVWVMGPEDRLVTKPVEIAHRGRDEVYVTGGLDDGDRVVRTNLTAPVEGMLLRVASDTPRPADPMADADAEDARGG